MAEIKEPPVAILETIEDVRAIMHQDPNRLMGFTGLDTFKIKSLWLISIINEILASGQRDFAYNADVKKLAEQHLGLPSKNDAEYSREGDALSRLIYNAQCYRRSDALLAEGYQPFTDEFLLRAFRLKQFIQFSGIRQIYKVRLIGGKLYAQEPRKRKYAMAVMEQPARLVDSLEVAP